MIHPWLEIHRRFSLTRNYATLADHPRGLSTPRVPPMSEFCKIMRFSWENSGSVLMEIQVKQFAVAEVAVARLDGVGNAMGGQGSLEDGRVACALVALTAHGNASRTNTSLTWKPRVLMKDRISGSV